jgi:hypothetical protein
VPLTRERYDDFRSLFRARPNFFRECDEKLNDLVAGGRLSQMFVLRSNQPAGSDAGIYLDAVVYPYFLMARFLEKENGNESVLKLAGPSRTLSHLKAKTTKTLSKQPAVHEQALRDYRLFLNLEAVLQFLDLAVTSQRIWKGAAPIFCRWTSFSTPHAH